LGGFVLHEFAQARFDGRFGIQVAEDFDFLLKFVIRNWFDECFGSGGSGAVEFADLTRRGASDVESFAFCGNLADESDLLSFRDVKAAQTRASSKPPPKVTP
jgi:hypothetical protein